MLELETENARLRERVQQLETELASRTAALDLRDEDDLRLQVYEFHQHMGVPVHQWPQVPDDKRVIVRLTLGAEEFFEELAACFPVNPALRDAVMDEIRYCKPCVNLPALVDGWADSNYIRAGNALEFGVDMRPIQREVQRTNMTKLPGNLRADGKILKPADWQPPQIARLLREQGWEG